MLGQGPFEQLNVQPGGVLDHVGQRVIRDRIQENIGITQGQIQVDQRDAVLRLGGQDAAKIDGRGSCPHAAGRAGHRDHFARPRTGFAGPEFVLADPGQRLAEFLVAQRQGQKLDRPGSHRFENQRPFGARTGGQDRDVGILRSDPSDQPNGGFRIIVDRDHADVGRGLLDDVGEKFKAAAIGFQPHRVDRQQHRFDALAGPVIGIDQCDS